MARSNRASIMPSKAEKGGDFGFPTGSIVTITDAAFVTWSDAGEKAAKGRADDPCLKLVGEVEGQDDPVTVHLGAGKATRLVPSRDGEFLEIAENSSATANSESSKSNIFLASLCDKKQHGKKTYPEKQLDELPISEALIGLQFVAGSTKVEYNFKDDDEGGGGKKNQTTLVADEIKELPKSVGGEGVAAVSKKKKSVKDDDEDEDEDERPAKKSSKKPARDEDDDEDDDEDEEDEKPAPKKSSKKGKGGDPEELAEKTVLSLFENPKFRKGIPENSVYVKAYSLIKEDAGAEDAMEFVQDDKWMQHKDRPWAYDDGVYTPVD